MPGETEHVANDRKRPGLIVRIVVIWSALFAVDRIRADALILHSGGLIRGRITDGAPRLGSKPALSQKAPAANRAHQPATISVTTLTGARLVLESSQVRSITRRPLLVEDYEVRKQHTPDEVESLWKLAEWCKGRGLKPQREETLRRILILDPEHAGAHQGLGQSRYDGKWKTRDEEMRSRGFVKFEGRYVALQEVDILKKMHSRKKVEQDWTERVRNWSYALSSSDPEKRRRGHAQLLKIADPNAIPALNKVLRSSEDEVRRSLYVKILSRLPGPEPVRLLVEQSLFDASKNVRVEAQDVITPQVRDAACPIYARELRNADNEVVRRAGRMLEKIGDESVVKALIEAIITTHQVPVNVVDNSNAYGFNPHNPKGDPNTLGLPPDVAGKLLTGQYPNGVTFGSPSGEPQVNPRLRTVMVDREFRNPEVLQALESLTKQSLGYNKDQWRRWWAARTTTGSSKPLTSLEPPSP
jgi:hypothetical protein